MIETVQGNTVRPLAAPSVDILGVPVDPVSKTRLLHEVLTWAREAGRRTIMYVNAHCMNVASTDNYHLGVLQRADLVYADGIGVVWAGRLLHGISLEKITGRDWIDGLCDLAAAQSLRLFILAGETGVAQKAAENLRRRWPSLQIVGAYDGYFSENSEAEILAAIKESSPHIVLVGMNTPTQEKWLADHRAQIAAPVCWAVGALFDYVAGIEPPVPGWMNTLALEWLWRMLMDPRGKWRRYLLGNPWFLYRVLRERFI